MTQTQFAAIAAEAEAKEREVHTLRLWTDSVEARIKVAFLKRQEKEEIYHHLAQVIGHLRLAEEELLALAGAVRICQ